jgi:hypothetical protein
MLLFRHVGKTSSIPPPTVGLTVAIVVVVRRRKEYHVVAAVEGHGLKAPETEHRPGLERLLETEREMCPWAISKYFGDLVSNTSA